MRPGQPFGEGAALVPAAAQRAQGGRGRVAAAGDPSGERALRACRRGTGDTGDLTGRVDARAAGALVVVHGHEFTATCAAQRTPRRQGQLELGAEAVRDAHRVDRERALGARHDRPVGAQPGGDDLLDPAVAARLDDAAAGPEGDAVADQQGRVCGEFAGLAELGRQLPGPPGPAAGQGAHRAGLQHLKDAGARLQQRGGHREQERSGAGDHHLITDHDPLPLGERLCRAGGEDAGQLPAGERQHTVVGADREHQRVGVERQAAPPAAVGRAAQHVHPRHSGLCRLGAFQRPDGGLGPPGAPRVCEHPAAAPVEGLPAVLEPLGPGGVVGVGQHAVVLAAGLVGRVDQGDPGAGAQRGLRGGEARGPRSDHRHMAFRHLGFLPGLSVLWPVSDSGPGPVCGDGS